MIFWIDVDASWDSAHAGFQQPLRPFQPFPWLFGTRKGTISMNRKLATIALPLLLMSSASAGAWFIILPIPNFQKPAALNNLIDALERSDETKALAYVSEDKTFGSKMWVWGHHAGHVTQTDADQRALRVCQQNLDKAVASKAGGKELYDFGSKKCELYEFSNKTVSNRIPEATPIATPVTVPATVPATAPAVANPSEPTKEAVARSDGAKPTNAPQPTVAPAAAPVTAGGLPSIPNEVQPTPRVVSPAASSTSTPIQQSNSVAPASGESPTARKLRELNELRKEGVITQKDYDEKKKKLLESM